MAPRVRIISRASNRVLTIVDDRAAGPNLGLEGLGKRGLLVGYDLAVPQNEINQLFELRLHPNLGVNVYSIHAARNPNNEVVRYTPLLPSNNVLLWQNEFTTPLQYWIIVNDQIRPYENVNNIENCCLHSSSGAFSCDGAFGARGEKFYFDIQLSSLPMTTNYPMIEVSQLTVVTQQMGNISLNSVMDMAGQGPPSPNYGAYPGQGYPTPGGYGPPGGMVAPAYGTDVSNMFHHQNSQHHHEHRFPSAPSIEPDVDSEAIEKLQEVVQKQEEKIELQDEEEKKRLDQIERIRAICEG